MNVILIGYRGSGKSSIGKKLANELWKDFVDLDDKVRAQFNGMKIADIWEQHGEAAFRDAEAKAVTELLKSDDLVIALGGGTLTTEAGLQAVQAAENAMRIYLECDADVLAERIAGDSSTSDERPSLTGSSNPADEVKEVLAQRDPVYRAAADIIFGVSHCSIEEAARHLINKL